MQMHTLDTSLRIRYEAGTITLRQAAEELCIFGWYNYLPSEAETLKTLYHNTKKE